jgi:hypothetical protein
VLSPFAAHEERINARLAIRHNEFVAAIADRVLIVYAEPSRVALRSWHKQFLSAKRRF